MASRPTSTAVWKMSVFQKETPFTELRDGDLKTFGNGAAEANTLYTLKIHLAHIAKTVGEKFPTSAPTLATLQKHVNRLSHVAVVNGPAGGVKADGHYDKFQKVDAHHLFPAVGLERVVGSSAGLMRWVVGRDSGL